MFHGNVRSPFYSKHENKNNIWKCQISWKNLIKFRNPSLFSCGKAFFFANFWVLLAQIWHFSFIFVHLLDNAKSERNYGIMVIIRFGLVA